MKNNLTENFHQIRKENIEHIKTQISKALERSTFHGIDVILDSPVGWKRLLVSAFVIVMSIAAAICAIILLISFLNFPYKTLVNYEQKSFQFPEITLCPFSPFNELQFKSSSIDMQEKFEKILNFWTNNNPGKINLFTLELKRSFTAIFYQYANDLKNNWYTSILSCYYNGLSCLQMISSVEHPMAYNCFQISLNLTESEGARSGFTRGIELILFRNNSLKPMLMTNEFFDNIFSEFKSSAKSQTDFNGILILIHNKKEIPAFKLTASSNVYPINFGKSISITVKERYYKQTRTKTRICSRHPVYYDLLNLQDFYMSRIINSHNKKISLNMDNCISIFRQNLVASQCNCFSELEMIPIDLVEKFKIKGFCHDIFWHDKKSKQEILQQIECMKQIELLTNEEILKQARSSKSYKSCKPPCDRFILNIKRIETNFLLDSMKLNLFNDFFKVLKFKNLKNPFQNLDLENISLSSNDLIYIDIHAEEERIPILDEDLDKNLSNFIAEIGGVFSLFLGLSGVTAFEIMECCIYFILIVILLFSKDKITNNKS